MTAGLEGGVGSKAALINGIHPNANDFDLDGLLIALQAMRAGDFSVRLPGNWTELAGKIADTFNDIVSANQRMAQQLELVGQAVGREGKPGRGCVSARRAAPGSTWNSRSMP